MNLRELASEAEFNVTEFGIFFGAMEDDVEANLKKFAELVVKQCADHLCNAGGGDLGNDLLEHFGMDEE